MASSSSSRLLVATASSSRLLVATASSSRLSTAPCNAPRRRSASTRAAQLASAAQASQLQTSEEAPPLPLAQSQYLGANAGEDGLTEDDESSSPYTSSQLRLSPLGRLSKWQDSGPRLLPRPFIDAVDDEIRAGNGKLIRRDLKEVLSTAFDPRDSTAPIKTGRQALLSLAKDSAARYAAIRQVLGTVEQRLSQGEESWSPTHVVDVGSARAEGLWAAADVWPSTLRTWTGKESSTANIKVAKSLLARNAENEEPHPVNKVHRNFETLREGAANVSVATDVPGQTLLLSSHRLLALPSDSHREQHVKKLWRSGAETIVLIEEGSDRGFAAIASARALLLELGEEAKQAGAREDADVGQEVEETRSRDSTPREKLVLGGVEFHEERPEDRLRAVATTSSTPPPAQGSWIVAPCPHDRPCPLLHPFSLSHPHEARPSSTRSPTRTRLSRHHEAEHVGLSSCLHPVRFLPPRWSTHEVVEKRRRQREKGGREERSARVAYVVVKRGERPSIARLQGEERRAVVEAAKEARKGILDELRKGDSLMPRRLPEDVVGEGEDSEEAQRELLKLLPGALKEAGASGEESEEALRHVMAQMGALQEGNAKGEDVWAASSELAEAQEEDAVDEDAAAAQEANEDWLRAATNVDADTPATPSSSALPYLLSSLPRIVLPPIKKGGHVTFDACHSNGSIQRYTIAKSAGKQVYQEARKSAWADLWSQDPVEAIAEGEEEGEGSLEVVDEKTGKWGWVKRKGWGQWYRISAAAPEGMGAMGAAAAMPAGRASSTVISQDGRTWVVEEEEEVLDEEDDAALAEEDEADDVDELEEESVFTEEGVDPFSLEGTARATDPSLLSTSKNARIKGGPSPASRKASSRPSAAIGADQVCPRPPVPGGDDRVAEYRKTRGGERKQAKHAYRKEIQQALRETAAAERGAFAG